GSRPHVRAQRVARSGRSRADRGRSVWRLPRSVRRSLAQDSASRETRGRAGARRVAHPLGLNSTSSFAGAPKPAAGLLAIQNAKSIWMNGRWVPWEDARIHVLAHVAHYASSVFEGIRAYRTRSGPAIFRLEEHLERLMFSARVYRMEPSFTREQIREVCLEVV